MWRHIVSLGHNELIGANFLSVGLPVTYFNDIEMENEIKIPSEN